MKHRISVDDLWKLAPEQREKLWEWWQPKEEDIIYAMNVPFYGVLVETVYSIDKKGRLVCLGEDYDAGNVHEKDECLPLLSIGQMIELLEGRYNEVSFGYNDSGCFWSVNRGVRGVGNMLIERMGVTTTAADELCDALWEAVRETL